MNPPESLVTALETFDRQLRVRWASALDRFAIERRHGVAGDNQKVLGTLLEAYRAVDAQSSRFPLDLGLAAKARARWEEFCSRRDGYQILLFLNLREAQDTDLVVERLAQMDVRRAGGAYGFWKRWLALEEEKEQRKRAERQEKLRAGLEEAYDRQKAGRKDWYAGGEMDGLTPVQPRVKPPDPTKSLTAPVLQLPVEE